MKVAAIFLTFFLSSHNVFSEVIRDYYAEPGLHAFKESVNQNANEFIDPFGGSLSIKHTDLTIPGNGGLDIVINRIYNSRQNDIGLRTVTGVGWTIHFGRVVVNDSNINKVCTQGSWSTSVTDNPSLELADGSRQLLVFSNNQTRAYLVTKNNWKAECLSSGSGLLVTSPSGTQYLMDQYEYNGTQGADQAIGSYYTSKITDRNGNFLTINYTQNFGLTYIDNIASSDGRSVNFTYKFENSADVLLSTISANGQIWRYNYNDASTNPLYANYKNLIEVVSPESVIKWKYSYYPLDTAIGASNSYSLKQITYPTGGSILYNYDLVDFNDSNYGTTVVSKKRVYEGTTLKGTWTFLYQPSVLFTTSIYDKTTITAPNGKYVYQHFGYNKAVAGEMWRVGLLYDKKIYNSSNALIQTEVNQWTSQIISGENFWHGRSTLKIDNNTAAPYLLKRTITRDNTVFVTDYVNYDEFGNPESIVETQGANTRATAYTYVVDTNKWLLNITKDESITGLAGNIKRAFDANGNLTREDKYGVITSYFYYVTGDLQKITDPRGNSINYDIATNLGAASSYYRGIPRVENYPQNITITRTVNPTGTIASETNGRLKTTSYSYDNLNRLIAIIYPKAGSATTTIVRNTNSKIITRGLFTHTAIYDGFGRTINTNANGVVVSNNYDVLGQKVFTSYPNKTIGTSTTYDVLGRVLSISHPDSSQTFNYLSGNRISVTNEKGFTTTNSFRSYGNPDEQFLMNSSAPEAIIISYTRNKLDQIKTISQGGKTRVYGYDSRYYLTSINNPETGLTIYGRDNAGNMISSQVGLSGITAYTYDGLNRLKTIDYPSTTVNPDVTKSYYDDNTPDTTTRNGVVRKLNYDDNGNLISNTLSLDGKNFSLLYSYDILDNLNTITYPSGRVVDYAPNALGRATTASPYVANVSYHANGVPNTTTFANGITETKTLTPNRDRVDLVTIAKGSSTIVDYDYDYDFRGNVTSVTNFVDRTKDLLMTGYDGLDRLTSVTGSWGVGTISYNALGNITSKNIGTANLTYTYDSVTDKLINTIGFVNNSYLYDDYGNVTNNGTNTFVFDDASNMLSATGTTSLQNTYDGDNLLVKSVKSSYTTYHLYDQSYNLMGEYNSSGTLRKETVRLNGKVVAVITEVPENPGIISVSPPDGAGGYTVSWGSSAGDLSHYEVAVSSSSSCDTVTTIGTSNTLNYNVTNQTDGTYYYCVRACNGAVCGDYKSSGSSCAVVGLNSAPCLPPGVITLPLTSTTGNYTVSWLATTGVVTHYELYEANDAAYTNQTLAYSGTALSFDVLSKIEGTYYYRLRACNNTACSGYLSGFSTNVTIPPVGLSSITLPPSSISGNYTVSWVAATGNVTHYELYESYSSIADPNIIALNKYYINNALLFDFSNKPEGYYSYTISACNGSVCSAGVAASITVLYTPGIPTILNPITNSSGYYTVSWLATTGIVTYYQVLEATDVNFTNSVLVYSGNLLSIDLGLKPDASYYYKVQACNELSCSPYAVASNATAVSGSPFVAVLMGIISNLLLN